MKTIVASVVMTAALVFGFAGPANAAVGTPTDAHVSFTQTYATVGWSAATGASSYTVIVSKDGYSGPFRGYTTTATSIQISFKDFPYQDGSSRPYRFTIQAAGGGSTSAIKAFSPSGGGVSTSNQSAAGQKVADCIHQGSAAGLVTAGGAGLVTLAAVWIPGVDAVTAGGAALAIAGSAAGTYIVCILN
ncbi:hypothetical protein [Leifsonia sp. Leaf336]|uniref:hypothetical protein n=1 Tax=Leifsonia sp. Leaf336 TaxID=1736341 RepID=UPI0012FA4695|nr:hypothetical protein [Leifsonia sp. Leaf336]